MCAVVDGLSLVVAGCRVVVSQACVARCCRRIPSDEFTLFPFFLFRTAKLARRTAATTTPTRRHPSRATSTMKGRSPLRSKVRTRDGRGETSIPFSDLLTLPNFPLSLPLIDVGCRQRRGGVFKPTCQGGATGNRKTHRPKPKVWRPCLVAVLCVRQSPGLWVPPSESLIRF